MSLFRRPLLTNLCLTALGLTGCTTMGGRPQAAWRASAPEATLGTEQPLETRRPETDSSPRLSLPPRAAPDAAPPRAATPPEAPRLPRIGRIEPDDVTTGGSVELSIDAPGRRQVGSDVVYRIAVRNGSDQTERGLAVRCRFEQPLRFCEGDQREVVQDIERLLPNETTHLTLCLRSDQPGPACCRFLIVRRDGDQETELASREACVEYVSRPLGIDIQGPAQRTEGSRAEYNVTLLNHSVKTLTDLRAVLTFDQALVPKEASAGREFQPGSLTWKLGTLQPMESVQLQVEFECRTLARRACLRLEVSSAEVAAESDAACLEIVPVAGTLDVQISDRDDPLEVGRRGRYEVTIHNLGLQPARRIALEAFVPAELKFVSATVREGESDLRLGSREQDGKLIFDAAEELAPDGRLVYVIEVEPTTAALVEFRVRMTSALSATPVTTAESTTLVEP